MFWNKKKEDDESTESEEEPDNSKPEESPVQESLAPGTGEAAFAHVNANIEKLKAQVSTFFEMQKSSNERFSTINEQLGGIRTMMMERDKDTKLFEAKATQAIDMVESVQPDKLMMELKKMGNKVEILKSSVQTNEIIMNNTITELKDMRTKINLFKGIEEAVKLSVEVKKDWLENKKLDANITKHASKVETIYSEMWKEFSEFKKIASRVTDLDKSLKLISSEIDSVKVKISAFSSKKEMENLLVKFESFEKYVNNVAMTLNAKISDFSADFGERFKRNMEKATKLISGFEILAAKTPDLDKYFNLLEEESKKAVKEDVKVEKIKTPGEEEKLGTSELKQGFFAKVKGTFGK